MLTKNDLLKQLEEQLGGLAKSVEVDTDLPVNIADYNVTLNSLRKRIEKAHAMPDGAVVANPLDDINNMTPKQRASATMMAMNPHTHPPMTDRRAAIEHTHRKLNESGNNS